VATYYAVGAILLGVAAIAFRPWALPLLWPAVALAVVSAGHFGLGPAIYRKQNGVLPWSTRILLAPALLGQWLSLAHYARQCRPWDRLTDHVWIGRRLSNAEARDAIAHGVSAVLDLTGEFSEAAPFRQITYRSIPIMDLTAPTPGQVAEAVDFIRSHTSQGIVYIHCKIGYSRTAAVAGCYLLATGAAENANDAIRQLQSTRPGIVIRPEAIETIAAFPTARQ
jgi:protein-tyrosine phosphatase